MVISFTMNKTERYKVKKTEEHIKEVYAHYGLAIYYAQCLERALCILLVAENAPNLRKISRADYEKMLESLFRQPFGSLIKRLSKIIDIPSDFEKNLREVLKKRNWLVHHYFWDRAEHFMTKKGREFMLNELQVASKVFDNFDNEISHMTDAWAKKHGITEERIKKHMLEMIKQV